MEHPSSEKILVHSIVDLKLLDRFMFGTVIRFTNQSSAMAMPP